MKEIRYEDVGVDIIVTVKDQDDTVVDLSSSTTKEIVFNKSDNTVATKSASFVTDGTDGQIKYQTESGFINSIGIWEAQAHVIIGSTDYTSSIFKFRVSRKIS